MTHDLYWPTSNDWFSWPSNWYEPYMLSNIAGLIINAKECYFCTVKMDFSWANRHIDGMAWFLFDSKDLARTVKKAKNDICPSIYLAIKKMLHMTFGVAVSNVEILI